jgi:hypothetical protein
MKSTAVTTLSVATFLSAMGCGGAGPSGTSPPGSSGPPSSGAPSSASTAGTSTSGTSTSGAPDTGASDPGNTVNFGLTLVNALAGVKVCIYPALTECQTSDTGGHLVLPVPANSPVAISVDGTAVDHGKLLLTVMTSSADSSGPLNLLTLADEKTWADAAGFTNDTAKGTIIGEAVGQLDGVTMTLTPSSGAGPVYLGHSVLPDKTLTATTASGSGLAIFGDIAPGDYMVSFSGNPCSIGTKGWQGAGQGVARVPTVAGYRTLVAADCN